MSAFVLEKKEIDTLTTATAAALQLNKKYPASYGLNDSTVEILGKYADDLHNLYRALYITNIKAVNGRYGDDQKTLPKYTQLRPWDTSRIDVYKLKKAVGLFGCYMYQCSEDPVYGSAVFKAIDDVYRLLCTIYVKKVVGWEGEDAI